MFCVLRIQLYPSPPLLSFRHKIKNLIYSSCKHQNKISVSSSSSSYDDKRHKHHTHITVVVATTAVAAHQKLMMIGRHQQQQQKHNSWIAPKEKMTFKQKIQLKNSNSDNNSAWKRFNSKVSTKWKHKMKYKIPIWTTHLEQVFR